MRISRRSLLTSTLPFTILNSHRRLTAAETAGTPKDGGIVFVGSSIFRFWTHLAEQMAPLPVLNTAIAGTVTQDMLYGIDRLVIAYKPRIVVYYCGSNDISGGEEAGPIVERTKLFAKNLQERLPNCWFFYTAIQKAPEKQERWNSVDAVNADMKKFTAQAKNTGYIDLNPVLFDAQGRVRANLFLPDGLHFRPDGTAYPEFARIVKPVLTKAWESGAGLAR
ncbi:MAG: GDSL-type esterase/lipase family protein [Bryobacteraceae bacterium]